MRRRAFYFLNIFMISLLLSGCATYDKAKRADGLNYELMTLKKRMEKMEKEKDAEIERLTKERDDAIARLQAEKQLEVKKVEEIKGKELSDLEKAKLELEKRLRDEIGEYKAKLKMTERGLVVTFLSEIFFDSGKDMIRQEGGITLKKVAQVLNANVPDTKVAVEGHTDDDPIRHSGWKSNWELSTARALAVVHYFIDKEGVAPERLSAVGYGEYRPVQSNSTVEGRQQNRRVEIVILPSKLKKVKD